MTPINPMHAGFRISPRSFVDMASPVSAIPPQTHLGSQSTPITLRLLPGCFLDDRNNQ